MRIPQIQPKFGYSPNITPLAQPFTAPQHQAKPSGEKSDARLLDALKAKQLRFAGYADFRKTLQQLQFVSIAPGYEDMYLDAVARESTPRSALPSIIERTDDGGKIAVDPYSLMFASNIVYFSGPVTDRSAEDLTVQLNYLMNKFEQEKSAGGDKKGKKDDEPPKVRIVINSPGGSVLALYKIVDTMNALKRNGVVIETVCEGLAASAASVMLVNGSKGHRFITENSQVMIHQPSYGAYGKHTEITISYKQGEKHYERLAKIMADNMGKDPEQVRKDLIEDNWMDSQQSLEYGIVDGVVTR